MQLQVGVKALIKKGDSYLFLRRSQSFEPGPQKWDIPGGRIEPEEPLHEALRREVREETGMKLHDDMTLLDAQDIFVDNKDLHVVRLTYLTSAEGEVIVSDEHDAYEWMSLERVMSEQHVDSYLREVLENL